MTTDNIGWLRISKGLREHWLWSNDHYLKWWLDLLMLANWQDRKTLFGGKLYLIKRGQLIASISALQERWKYCVDLEGKEFKKPCKATVLKFLGLLVSDSMILRDTTTLPKSVSIITIVNYAKYQNMNDDAVTGAVTDAVTDAVTGAVTDAVTGAVTGAVTHYKEYSIPLVVEEKRKIKESGSRFFDEMAANESWREVVCMKYHIGQDELGKRIEDFRQDCIIRNKQHDSLREVQEHFANWLPNRLRIEREESQHQRPASVRPTKPRGSAPRKAGTTADGRPFGPGEYIAADGRRTYGSGRANIPMDAPPRPNEQYSWSAESDSWIII